MYVTFLGSFFRRFDFWLFYAFFTFLYFLLFSDFWHIFVTLWHFDFFWLSDFLTFWLFSPPFAFIFWLLTFFFLFDLCTEFWPSFWLFDLFYFIRKVYVFFHWFTPLVCALPNKMHCRSICPLLLYRKIIWGKTFMLRGNVKNRRIIEFSVRFLQPQMHSSKTNSCTIFSCISLVSGCMHAWSVINLVLI